MASRKEAGDIAEEIVRLHRLGWTQDKIARAVGRTQPHVSNVLKARGETRPRRKRAPRRAERIRAEVSTFAAAPWQALPSLAEAEISPSMCFKILQECKERTSRNHTAAAAMVEATIELFRARIESARKRRNLGLERRFRCDCVQALGLRAACARRSNQPAEAVRILEDALHEANGCKACHADLQRRLGLAYMYQRRFDRALECLTESLRLYAVVDGNGHDLNGQPRESCLASRSALYTYTSRFELGERDAREALAALPEKGLRSLRLNLLTALAWCQLRLPGSISVTSVLPFGARVDEAKATLFEATALFDMDDDSQHSAGRASIYWLSGVIDGLEGNRLAADFKLGTALDDYLALPLPDEAMVCAADRARLVAANPRKAQDCLRGLGWPDLPECLADYRPKLAALLAPPQPLSDSVISRRIDEIRAYAMSRIG